MRRRAALAPFVLFVLLMLTAPSQAVTCDGFFHQVPTVDPSTISAFYGVTGTTANNIWAVGSVFETSAYQTLVEHWTGSAWSVVSSPSPAGDDSGLLGADALSANNIWAVGFHQHAGNYRSFVEHWNGSSWRIVPSPSPSSTDSSLEAVDAVSANDVWAVGHYASGGTEKGMILHWDGQHWRNVSSPAPGSRSELFGVGGRTAGDAWAVGSYDAAAPGRRTLALHWDGSRWRKVTSMNNGPLNNDLQDIQPISARTVLAVGNWNDGTNTQSLIEKWTGHKFKPVALAPVGVSSGLLGISAASGTDITAVGQYSAGAIYPLALHWNGSTWSTVPADGPSGTANIFYDVVSFPSNTQWAVGADNESPTFTLAETHCP